MISKIEQFRNAVEANLALADVKYGTSLYNNVAIRFDIRGYRCAGQAGKRGTALFLRFHPEAIEEHFEEMLNVVIPHEVAHIVNYAAPHTGKNHNPGWKRVCVALGGTGDRTHTMSFGSRPSKEDRALAHDARRPYVYIDSKGVERRLTKVRHNKLQQTWGGYSLTYRDNRGVVDGNSKWSYSKVSVISNKKVAAPKKRKVQKNRATKGGMSKAQIARNLIKLHFPAGPDQLNQKQIIAKIADTCGLSNGLAKTYFNNNLAKAVAG